MEHPWEQVRLEDYEAHMSLPVVGQLGELNRIMREQLTDYPARTALIAGVAGGNGLEHIAGTPLQTVYGIDINAGYLEACRKRYASLEPVLVLKRMDLASGDASLPITDLVIANLIVEYIGIDPFSRLIGQARPAYLSSVIQLNSDGGFVSASPYEQAFAGLTGVHRDVAEEEWTAALLRIGYTPILRREHPLPTGKRLMRLDYRRQEA